MYRKDIRVQLKETIKSNGNIKLKMKKDSENIYDENLEEYIKTSINNWESTENINVNQQTTINMNQY